MKRIFTYRGSTLTIPASARLMILLLVQLYFSAIFLNQFNDISAVDRIELWESPENETETTEMESGEDTEHYGQNYDAQLRNFSGLQNKKIADESLIIQYQAYIDILIPPPKHFTTRGVRQYIPQRSISPPGNE